MSDSVTFGRVRTFIAFQGSETAYRMARDFLTESEYDATKAVRN